jgi:hypothetical protein
MPEAEGLGAVDFFFLALSNGFSHAHLAAYYGVVDCTCSGGGRFKVRREVV